MPSIITSLAFLGHLVLVLLLSMWAFWMFEFRALLNISGPSGIEEYSVVVVAFLPGTT